MLLKYFVSQTMHRFQKSSEDNSKYHNQKCYKTQLPICRGVVQGGSKGLSPLFKIFFKFGGLTPPPPLKILILTERICDRILANFKIWH